MTVFISYRHINGERLSGRSFKSSFNWRAVIEVASHGKLHVIICNPYIVGRIITHPAGTWHPCLNPGMSSTFAPHATFVRTNIAANVSAGYAKASKHFQHDVCKVLAYTRTMLQYFFYRSFNSSNTLDVFE